MSNKREPSREKSPAPKRGRAERTIGGVPMYRVKPHWRRFPRKPEPHWYVVRLDPDAPVFLDSGRNFRKDRRLAHKFLRRDLHEIFGEMSPKALEADNIVIYRVD